jgi:cytochrome P450
MPAPIDQLDKNLIRELYDLRNRDPQAGVYDGDPYPEFHRLRESGPVHEGTVHELIGVPGNYYFEGLPFPDRRHFSTFSFETCVAALSDELTFPSHLLPPLSAPEMPGGPLAITHRPGQPPGAGIDPSLLNMGGDEHRRYRALVQTLFVPGKMDWWKEKWVVATADALVDSFVGDGRADLNLQLCAAIPLLTITGSFGIATGDALNLRAIIRNRQSDARGAFNALLEPIVAARRRQPEDDLVSVLCNSEVKDEDGSSHRLDDDEIIAFSWLLLSAGSGTTWKQMGITLTALLATPGLTEKVRADRSLVKPLIEESLRWNATDPMFSRFVARDVDFFGTHLPAGSVVHLCFGAANRDPARWERPDDFDPFRPALSHLAFGGGPHICLGMHVARAEMSVAVNAVLDRLPNVRLDPDAEQPRIIGMYERGPTAVPVVFG